MNKEQPVTLTLQELDNTIFQHLTAAMTQQFPTEHRTALKVAMHVADGAMAEFEALAKRQSKSRAATTAAEARWSGTAPTPTANPSTPAPDAAPVGFPAATPKKRTRRTKAQIAADHEAQIAAMAGVPVPVPPAPPDFASLAKTDDGGTFVPATPEVAAAIAAASGSPVNTPSTPDVPAPPPLQIPTFGSPSP